MSTAQTPEATSPPVAALPPGVSVPAAPRRKRESIWRMTGGDVPWPIVDDVVIDDGGAVDGIFSEKQMRLLTEPLYSSWPGPEPGVPFVALANVGLFWRYAEPPIVPDVLLSVEVAQLDDMRNNENQSYFAWARGKMPDVVIEVVSNREGGEDTDKLRAYAHIGIPYYIIFDTRDLLGGGVLRVLARQPRRYRPLAEPYFFEDLGLGVALWQGRFEGLGETWLRWCDKKGRPIPTGAEKAAREKKRARNAERAKAEAERAKGKAEEENKRLKAKLRAAGIDPNHNGS